MMAPRPGTGPPDEFVEAVFTCKGDYYDPNFPLQLESFYKNLHGLLNADRDKLVIKKVEPWNSVKVTVNIPKEAAEQLKTLAVQNNGAALRNLGIMSLQMEGDRIISLTFSSNSASRSVHSESSLTDCTASTSTQLPQASSSSKSAESANPVNNLFTKLTDKASDPPDAHAATPNVLFPSTGQVSKSRSRQRKPAASRSSNARRNNRTKTTTASAPPSSVSNAAPALDSPTPSFGGDSSSSSLPSIEKARASTTSSDSVDAVVRPLVIHPALKDAEAKDLPVTVSVSGATDSVAVNNLVVSMFERSLAAAGLTTLSQSSKKSDTTVSTRAGYSSYPTSTTAGTHEQHEVISINHSCTPKSPSVVESSSSSPKSYPHTETFEKLTFSIPERDAAADQKITSDRERLIQSTDSGEQTSADPQNSSNTNSELSMESSSAERPRMLMSESSMESATSSRTAEMAAAETAAMLVDESDSQESALAHQRVMVPVIEKSPTSPPPPVLDQQSSPHAATDSEHVTSPETEGNFSVLVEELPALATEVSELPHSEPSGADVINSSQQDSRQQDAKTPAAGDYAYSSPTDSKPPQTMSQVDGGEVSVPTVAPYSDTMYDIAVVPTELPDEILADEEHNGEESCAESATSPVCAGQGEPLVHGRSVSVICPPPNSLRLVETPSLAVDNRQHAETQAAGEDMKQDASIQSEAQDSAPLTDMSDAGNSADVMDWKCRDQETAEGAAESAVESAAESVVESATESVVESATESVVESATESIVESTAESVVVLSTESATESVAESAVSLAVSVVDRAARSRLHDHEPAENGSSTSTDSGVVAGSPKSDLCCTPPCVDEIQPRNKEDFSVTDYITSKEKLLPPAMDELTRPAVPVEPASAVTDPVADTADTSDKSSPTLSRPCASVVQINSESDSDTVASVLTGSDAAIQSSVDSQINRVTLMPGNTLTSGNIVESLVESSSLESSTRSSLAPSSQLGCQTQTLPSPRVKDSEQSTSSSLSVIKDAPAVERSVKTTTLVLANKNDQLVLVDEGPFLLDRQQHPPVVQNEKSSEQSVIYSRINSETHHAKSSVGTIEPPALHHTAKVSTADSNVVISSSAHSSEQTVVVVTSNGTDKLMGSRNTAQYSLLTGHVKTTLSANRPDTFNLPKNLPPVRIINSHMIKSRTNTESNTTKDSLPVTQVAVGSHTQFNKLSASPHKNGSNSDSPVEKPAAAKEVETADNGGSRPLDNGVHAANEIQVNGVGEEHHAVDETIADGQPPSPLELTSSAEVAASLDLPSPQGSRKSVRNRVIKSTETEVTIAKANSRKRGSRQMLEDPDETLDAKEDTAVLLTPNKKANRSITSTETTKPLAPAASSRTNGPAARSKRATRSSGVTDLQALPTIYRDRKRTKR